MIEKPEIKPTIGLEIHIELSTSSKMFCGCPTYHFGKPPNTQTCPTCLGLPGALPVPNIKAIEYAILIGLALNCKVNKESKFDRKHYFYPDLPKGYQISQYDEPLCEEGFLTISNKKVRIRRVHIEEDTGKLQHIILNKRRVSLVDFNRSGVPLVEIVTEPDLSSGKEAKEFAQKLQKIVRFLGVSDCDMEKGSMRLEANTSLGLHLGYKVEIKNLNSFRFVEKAIEYDLERQKKLLEKGIIPQQETRGFNESKKITVAQRYKEKESDYRYFPEPDIPPMRFSESFIKSIKKKIPELPDKKFEKFVKIYKLRKDYAKILSSDGKLSEYSERVFKLNKLNVDLNKLASLIINQKPHQKGISVNSFISKINKGLSRKFLSREKVLELVNEAFKSMPKAVEDYKKGKTNAISFLIGYVIKISKNKADPRLVKKILEEKLRT